MPDGTAAALEVPVEAPKKKVKLKAVDFDENQIYAHNPHKHTA
jgi:hypothetical protein